MNIKALILLTGVLLMASCRSTTNKNEAVSLYKDEIGQQIAHESYDEAMKLWPISYEEEWVKTEYGETHIIICGDKNSKPLFLLPGLFADATMWYPNVEELSKEYRVYVLDMINYGGKSIPSKRKVNSVEDYSKWFKSILTYYKYESTAIGGLSYCSWLSLALAKTIPDSVDAMILLDPSTTFMRMDGGIGWRGFWAFVFFPTQKKINDFFTWLGGGYTSPEMEIWFRHMQNVIEYGSVKMNDVPQHRTYTAEDLTMVKMPTLIMIGGKKILYKDPTQLAAKAREALPNAIVEVVENAGHSINQEKAEYINMRILSFLSENY